jgi:hypothetical protein
VTGFGAVVRWLPVAAACVATLPGCCSEIFFGRSYGPKAYSTVALPVSGSPARPVAGDDGEYPSEACPRLCPRLFERLEATSCAPVAVTVPHHAGRTVACDYASSGVFEAPMGDVPVPEGVSDAQPFFSGPPCFRVCGGAKDWRSCKLLPASPPPVEADARFVACHYDQPGGCRSSVYGAKLCR